MKEAPKIATHSLYQGRFKKGKHPFLNEFAVDNTWMKKTLQGGRQGEDGQTPILNCNILKGESFHPHSLAATVTKVIVVGVSEGVQNGFGRLRQPTRLSRHTPARQGFCYISYKCLAMFLLLSSGRGNMFRD